MKKLILAILTIINLSSSFIKAFCCEDSLEDDYQLLATSIKNLMDESAKFNIESERQNFINESGKKIKYLPSFYNLFDNTVTNCCYHDYFVEQIILTMIAEDLIIKSLNLLTKDYPHGMGLGVLPAPSGSELHGYIVEIIKQVRAKRNSCCVIL